MDLRRIIRAIRFASRAHKGQLYSDEPYINHVLRVAECVAERSLEHVLVAILHDVVEDTPTSVYHVRYMQGHDVAEAVDALTRRPKEEYKEYILRVKRNALATQVKLCDVTDHLKHVAYLVSKPSLKDRYEDARRVLSKGD